MHILFHLCIFLAVRLTVLTHSLSSLSPRWSFMQIILVATLIVMYRAHHHHLKLHMMIWYLVQTETITKADIVWSTYYVQEVFFFKLNRFYFVICLQNAIDWISLWYDITEIECILFHPPTLLLYFLCTMRTLAGIILILLDLIDC